MLWLRLRNSADGRKVQALRMDLEMTKSPNPLLPATPVCALLLLFTQRLGAPEHER